MRTVTSSCGLFNCGSCEFRAQELCPGCEEGNKKIEAAGGTQCALYACAVSSGAASCKDCKRQDCQMPRRIDYACPLRSAFRQKRWWAGRMIRFFEHKRRERRAGDGSSRISVRTVERLGWHLLVLQEMEDRGVVSVASREIAVRVGVSGALVRKDLARFGDFGTPSYGYSVRELIDKIREILSLDEPCMVAWIGAQRLAEDQRLLLDLAAHNCRVAAVLDTDETRIGAHVAGMRIEPLARISELVKEEKVNASVIAVSVEEAQRAADAAIGAGVPALLNLTTTVLAAPEGVIVRNASVLSEMMTLSFYSTQSRGLGKTD